MTGRSKFDRLPSAPGRQNVEFYRHYRRQPSTGSGSRPSARFSKANGWIHCHAYRQDEILMLMRLMERSACRSPRFEHTLEESYKMADVMAQHGAADRPFPIGGPTSSRSLTRSPTTARSCATPAWSSLSTPTMPSCPPPLPRSRQGREIRRRAAGRGLEVRHAQPSEPGANRPLSARSSRARTPTSPSGSRFAATTPAPLLADVDRRKEILRPRAKPGAHGPGQGTHGTPGQGEEGCQARRRRQREQRSGRRLLLPRVFGA